MASTVSGNFQNVLIGARDGHTLMTDRNKMFLTTTTEKAII